MSYFPTKISAIYPEAPWTGSSPIHTSIARNATIPYSMDNPRKLMKAITASDIPAFIYRVIEKYCPDMEWLMPQEAFNELILVDFYRMLNSQGAVETPQRLQNPSTGNYFHRIVLREADTVVGGVRVWVCPVSDDSANVGFRFRLEEQKSESKKVRQQAQQLVEALQPEMVELKEYVKKEVVEGEKVLEDYFTL